MDAASLKRLAHLVGLQRTASLGTLRAGSPEVTMVLYAPSPDFSAFWLHLSRLAHHTQNILADSRVSLMIAEPDNREKAAQTLVRVTIQGEASLLQGKAPEAGNVRKLYLARFPEAETMFELGDFALYRVVPKGGRFVAGFGKTFDLTPQDFHRAAGVMSKGSNQDVLPSQ